MKMLEAACIALGVAIATMRLFPETATARALHRWLVEAPVALVLDAQWLRLISGLVLLALMLAGPEMAAIVGAAGIDAAFIELVLAATAAGVLGRLRETAANVRGVIMRVAARRHRVVARKRARRPRRRIQPRKSDDSAGPGLAYA